MDARDVLLANENAAVPLRIALDALPALLDRSPAPATVRQWRHRGLLRPITRDNGVSLYRLGDIVRLALDDQPRTARTRRDVPWYDPTKPVGYQAAHNHVRDVYGAATDYDCLDCPKRAAHWTYNHGDPGAITDEDGRVYSLDVRSYEPRCASCHTQFDMRHARVSLA